MVVTILLFPIKGNAVETENPAVIIEIIEIIKKQVFRKYKLHMNSLCIKFLFAFTDQALPNNSSLLAELSKPNACKAEESWYWNNHRRRWPTRQHGS